MAKPKPKGKTENMSETDELEARIERVEDDIAHLEKVTNTIVEALKAITEALEKL